MAKIIGVKFKNTAKTYYFMPADENEIYEEKSGVVVETAKGLEYATVVFGVREVPESEIVHPLKKILRTKLLPEKPQKNVKPPKNNSENGEKKEHNGLFRKKKFTDKI